MKWKYYPPADEWLLVEGTQIYAMVYHSITNRPDGYTIMLYDEYGNELDYFDDMLQSLGHAKHVVRRYIELQLEQAAC